MKLTILAPLAPALLASVSSASPVEPRGLCLKYDHIYTGDRTVAPSASSGSQTVNVEQLGNLGLGRIYLPGPGLVNQATANTACKAACSLGLPNLKNCLTVSVYHKCVDDSSKDPYLPCGPNGEGTYWFCDFYSKKLTASDFQRGDGQGGYIRASQAFVQAC